MQSGEHIAANATCGIAGLHCAPNMHVASPTPSRFCMSLSTLLPRQRLACFWLKSAVSQWVQVSLTLLLEGRHNHMRAHAHLHESSSSDQSANATSNTVTVDWSTPSDGTRYKFINRLMIGDQVLVTNGDDRVRRAAYGLSEKYPQRRYVTKSTDDGLVIERLS
jgi:hypothetical protein